MQGVPAAETLTTPAATPSGIVLIFDQFEEILTANPIDLDAKRAFFERLGEALREDSGLWALFAMREDFATAIEPYLAPMPQRLQVRYRLDLLDERAAGLAISRPVEVAGATIAPEAVTHLVNELRKVRLQGGESTRSVGSDVDKVVEVPGPYVEPVQLQVVCDRFWARWRAARPGAKELTLEDATVFASIDQALEDYYRDRVRKVATREGIHDVGLETRIRQWIERQLITPSGVRGVVLRTHAGTQGLENALIEALVDQYLVRKDRRRGEEWFELAHDRLVAPVRKDNAAWSAENLAMLQLNAAVWDSQGRSDDLLLRDRDLAEAEHWARTHATRMSATDRAFLKASLESVTAKLVSLNYANYLIIKNLAIVAFAVALGAVTVATVCVILYLKAENAKKLAHDAERLARDHEAAARDSLEKFKQAQANSVRANDVARKNAERALENQHQFEQQQSLTSKYRDAYIHTRQDIVKNSINIIGDKHNQLVKIEDHLYSIDYTGGSLILKQVKGILQPFVPVSLDGVPVGDAAVPGSNLFNAVEIYDQTPGRDDFPLVWSDLVANAYVRSTYQKAQGPGASLGTSVLGSASFRTTADSLRLVPDVARAELSTGGPERVKNELEARFGPAAATVRSVHRYPDPVDGRTTTGLSVGFEAGQDIALDARQLGNDAFRLLTLSSMYSSDRAYDANVLRYSGPDGVIQTVRIGDLLKEKGGRRGFHLLPGEGKVPRAVALGDWFELVKEPGSTWFPDSPSIRVEVRDRGGFPGKLGIQGFLADSASPSEDSLSVWIEWVDAPAVIPSKTRVDFDFTVVARAPGRDDIEIRDEFPDRRKALYFKDLPGLKELPVPVTLNGRSVGSESIPGANLFNVVEIYNQAPGKESTPRIWSDFLANTNVQPAYQKADGTGSAQRTLVVAAPAYWPPASVQRSPIVSRSALSAAGPDSIRCALEASFESNPGSRAALVRSVRSYPSPVVDRTTTGLSIGFEALEDIPLDRARRGNDAFRLLSLSSMYSSAQQYDANVLRYASPSGQVHTIRLRDVTLRDAYLLHPQAAELGKWFELVKEPGSRWFPDSPSIRVEVGDGHGAPGRLGIQGYLTKDSSTGASSLSVWVEWLDAPVVITSKTKLDFDFTVVAQPPAQAPGD